MRKKEDLVKRDDMLEQLGYEPRDISIPVLIKWIGGLFVFLGIASAIAMVMYMIFVPNEPEQTTPQVPEASVAKLPPEPRIQGYPISDMQQYRAAEDVELAKYGWKDKTRGIVQIPIDRAIDLMVQRELPAVNTIGPATPGGETPLPTTGSLATVPSANRSRP